MLQRIGAGMLIGYVASVAVAVGQFIVRYGYFTLLQEIGAVFFGLFGAAIGGFLGIFKKQT